MSDALNVGRGEYRDTLEAMSEADLLAETINRVRNHRRLRSDSTCRALMDFAWGECQRRGREDLWMEAIRVVKEEEKVDRAKNQTQ